MIHAGRCGWAVPSRLAAGERRVRINATSEDGVTSVLKLGAESEPLAINRLDGVSSPRPPC